MRRKKMVNKRHHLWRKRREKRTRSARKRREGVMTQGRRWVSRRRLSFLHQVLLLRPYYQCSSRERKWACRCPCLQWIRRTRCQMQLLLWLIPLRQKQLHRPTHSPKWKLLQSSSCQPELWASLLRSQINRRFKDNQLKQLQQVPPIKRQVSLCKIRELMQTVCRWTILAATRTHTRTQLMLRRRSASSKNWKRSKSAERLTQSNLCSRSRKSVEHAQTTWPC